MVSALNL
jgi:uncharacterized membrane protein YeaQ/YmgE (transglycosylase-associated protein family)